MAGIEGSYKFNYIVQEIAPYFILYLLGTCLDLRSLETQFLALRILPKKTKTNTTGPAGQELSGHKMLSHTPFPRSKVPLSKGDTIVSDLDVHTL